MSKRVVPCLLITASIIFFFLLLELFLALFWPHKLLTRSYHEQYHPKLGWVNKPNADGYFYYRRDVRIHRHHNNHGLRMLRDVTYEKPAGIKRILLLGDSFFWGYFVDDQFVVSEVLQRFLGNSVEVINGAVTGYGTDQELLWLNEYGLRYSPDIVILGIFPTNDLDEISHSVMYGFPKPIFMLENGKLTLHNVPVPDTRETRRKAFEEPQTLLGKVKKFLRFHTHTYPFLAKRINAIPGMRDFLLKTGLAEEYTRALPGIKNITLPPDQAWPLYLALIKEIKAICEKNGIEFILVFIPEKENTPGAAVKYPDVTSEAVNRNDENSRFLKAFTEKYKIRFIDLLPHVRERHMKGIPVHNPEYYDHHWTPAGHRMAAEVLLSKLGTLPIFSN